MSIQESIEASSSLTTVDTPVGVPMTLQRQAKVEYQTSNGTKVYDKLLTGFKPIVFPTATSRNACFEYRFSIRDLILPRELPQVTDIYFKDLVVKIQDIFTEVSAHGAIYNGHIVAYQPYTAVLSQDENGIETEDHVIITKDQDGKEVKTTHKFITSDRVVKRDSSPIFVISSNLKFEKSFNQEVTTNSYKALAIYNVYDKDGNFSRKYVKSVVSISPEDFVDVIDSKWKDKATRKGRSVCVDVILCDVLIYCLKSFNLNGTPFSNIDESQMKAATNSRALPNGWLTPEEKLQKFGKKGTFMSEFSDTEPDKLIPNSLFQYVDMQERCNKLNDIGYPYDAVFFDKNHIIADFDGQYIQSNAIISLRVLSDQ